MATTLPGEVPKKDFHHPYTPYAIQVQFMTALYDCIEHGNVGIFESPTGTVSPRKSRRAMQIFYRPPLPLVLRSRILIFIFRANRSASYVDP